LIKKSGEIMSLKEIEKLREKVEKDPNSKLFVPLAEEYKKEGMLDDAIQVLLTGIERQPGYMSARVSLGKIYLEKGMPGEARTEFENVIKSIPDNLYAHKKLAEIYRDSGETELAIKSYKMILKLNSMDEDAMTSLHDLEAGSGPGGASEPVAGDRASSEEDLLEAHIHEATSEDAVADDFQEKDVRDAAAGPGQDDDELNAFKESLFGGADAGDDMPEEIIAEELPETEATADSAFAAVDAPAEDEAVEIEEIPMGDDEVIPEDLYESEDIVSGVPFATGAAGESKKEDEGEVGSDSIEEADRKVAEGDYGGAIRIYRKALSDNPDDKRALQRLEELRSLLGMLGKGKEELIAGLEGFLEGIHKRHDEFLGRT
jgi:tetratricopeptide (TPR) repeat protein